MKIKIVIFAIVVFFSGQIIFAPSRIIFGSQSTLAIVCEKIDLLLDESSRAINLEELGEICSVAISAMDSSSDRREGAIFKIKEAGLRTLEISTNVKKIAELINNQIEPIGRALKDYVKNSKIVIFENKLSFVRNQIEMSIIASNSAAVFAEAFKAFSLQDSDLINKAIYNLLGSWALLLFAQAHIITNFFFNCSAVIEVNNLNLKKEILKIYQATNLLYKTCLDVEKIKLKEIVSAASSCPKMLAEIRERQMVFSFRLENAPPVKNYLQKLHEPRALDLPAAFCQDCLSIVGVKLVWAESGSSFIFSV